MVFTLKYLSVIIISLFLHVELLIGRTVIYVRSQEECVDLSDKLLEKIKEGNNNIDVKFGHGIFRIKEKQLNLEGINAPNVNIRIIGRKTILIPSGREYYDGDKYEGNFSPHHSWMFGEKDIDIWSHMRYAVGRVEVLDENEKICRIKINENIPANSDCSKAYILIPHWFRSSIANIVKIESGYIYFKASDLARSSQSLGRDYNLNDDYYFGGSKNIRYKLCNVEIEDDCLKIIKDRVCLPKKVSKLREGRISNIISFKNSRFASITIKGINLYGCSGQIYGAALSLSNVECSFIQIDKCEFRGIRNQVVSIENTNNVIIQNSLFSDIYSSCIRTDNACKNTIIKNNSFYLIGKRLNQSFAMILNGENYYAYGNKIVDFGYGGIGVGVWYKSQKTSPCNGVIENNTLLYSDIYQTDISNFGLMDGGAIYVWTKNDGLVIRNNRINGYKGLSMNRGIFCDDGAYNVEITGNIITGIAKSYCIESYRKTSVEDKNTPGTGIERSNINVYIHDNIIDGYIRFEGNPDGDNGCILSNNYQITGCNSSMQSDDISNVEIKGETVRLEYTGKKNGKIGLSTSSYNTLRKSVIWNYARKYFIRKRK